MSNISDCLLFYAAMLVAFAKKMKIRNRKKLLLSFSLIFITLTTVFTDLKT